MPPAYWLLFNVTHKISVSHHTLRSRNFSEHFQPQQWWPAYILKPENEPTSYSSCMYVWVVPGFKLYKCFIRAGKSDVETSVSPHKTDSNKALNIKLYWP